MCMRTSLSYRCSHFNGPPLSSPPCRQWLPQDKVTPLGVDDTGDKLRMMEGRKTTIRKSVQVAYDRAMVHLSRVRRDQAFVPSNYL